MEGCSYGELLLLNKMIGNRMGKHTKTKKEQNFNKLKEGYMVRYLDVRKGEWRKGKITRLAGRYGDNKRMYIYRDGDEPIVSTIRRHNGEKTSCLYTEQIPLHWEMEIIEE